MINLSSMGKEIPVIVHPSPAPNFSKAQIQNFLANLEAGHDDDIALLRSGVERHQLGDLIAKVTDQKYYEARLRSRLPLVQVEERMNDIMMSANDPDQLMSPDLALEILERRNPNKWSKKQLIEVKPADPTLPPEELHRLQSIFGLTQVIDVEFTEKEGRATKQEE